MGKVLGIILLIIGIGVALYFFNSGGAQKIGSILPGASSSTVASPTITTASSSSSGGSNAFLSFLESILPHVAKSTSSEVYSTAPLSGSSGGSSGQSGSVGLSTPPSSEPSNVLPSSSTSSPYFHLVRIGGVSQSLISLYTYGNRSDSSTVDITGWEIKTNNGGEYIPQAVNVYDYTGLTAPSDIVLTLNANEYVYLYSNSSPVNLRLNECVGYLNVAKQFNPAMPDSCPSIPKAEISNFSGQCQNYINSLYDCQQPNMSSIYIPRNDYACQQFLENNFTYRSCEQEHEDDADFLSNQWRIWMGSSPLDKYHDNVELLDRNGLIVDSYSY